jgi:hypothetical protein
MELVRNWENEWRESISFTVHPSRAVTNPDINIFRRRLKDTFASSTDLNILLPDQNPSKKPNCRVQVLPVQWRQEIQFGVYNDTIEKADQEKDIGDVSDEDSAQDDSGNVTLEDITVESLAPIRTLISDGNSLPQLY